MSAKRACANELPIEHRVWHRSVVSGRVGGAGGQLHSHQIATVMLTASMNSNPLPMEGSRADLHITSKNFYKVP